MLENLPDLIHATDAVAESASGADIDDAVRYSSLKTKAASTGSDPVGKY